MDWSNIIIALITTCLGGGLGSLVTWRSTRKKGEFELWQQQLAQMGKELEFERQRHKDHVESHQEELDYLRARNQELVQERSQMRDDYEERIADKTARLREAQDREYKANAENAKLIEEVGDWKVKFTKYRCDDIECPWSKPPKVTTKPKPKGVTKIEYHQAKEQA